MFAKNLYFKAVIYFVSLFLISIPIWINKFFGMANFDQVIFTLKFGANGVITSDPIFIKRFLKWCIVSPLLATVIFLNLEKYLSYFHYFILNKFFNRKANPLPSLPIPLCVMLMTAAFIYFCYQFSILQFVKMNYFSKKQQDYFKLNYVNPNSISFHPSHPKSLILIYVESLEFSYSNEKIFKRNLLQSFDNYRDEALSFNHFEQVFGTGWTIAGLVSTQCGVPLKSLTVFGNNRQGEVINQFLSGAKCLSDILAENGYRNIYMKGASLKFGGVKQFLKSHQYTEMYGKDEWIKTGEDEKNMSGWGLSDDRLFEKAKKRLKSLVQSGQLFNLTLLTVDTHGTEGFLNSYCYQKGFQDFDGIIECTASEVSDFIQYIKQNGWLDKVSVVILGDHLAMKNPYYEQLQLINPRIVFNLILTTPKMNKRTDEINHFDMFPTILDILNINYVGGRLGLGYSGIKRKDQFPLPQNHTSKYEMYAQNYSETYKKLWE